jgi:hypothetical protein
LDQLRQAGFTVVNAKPSSAGDAASADVSRTSKHAPRKPPAPIDTGLGVLEKKGFVVLRKKTQSSPVKDPSASQKPTMSVEERAKLSAKRAAEAAKRVHQHRAAAAKKKSAGSPQQEEFRSRTEQRTLAEKNKLVNRARIYAMNCVMKAYRLLQIEAFKNGQSLEETGDTVTDTAAVELTAGGDGDSNNASEGDDRASKILLVDTRCLAV